MARILGPDNGSAYVFMPSGAPAAGRTATVYTDAACTTLADIAAYQPDLPSTPGAVIASAQVTADVNGRLNFWFPDATPAPALYVRFGLTGPVSRVTTDLQAQINLLVTGLATSLPLTGGAITGRLGVGTSADTNIRVTVAQAADSSGIWSVNTTAGGNVNSAHLRGDSTTAASLLLAGRVAGDTTSRYLATVNGAQYWGPGSGSTDTVLYRASAGHLHTEGQLSVNGGKVTPTTWINVCEKGAVGDDATDCTAAIQAAIDAVPVQGGTVYIPAGIYRTHAPITVRSALTIVGDGDGATVIAPLHVGSTLVGEDIDRLTIRGVWIEGTATTGGTGIDLTLDSANHTGYVTLTDVTVATVPGDGVAIENPIVSALTRVVTQTCGGWGFNLHGQPGGSAGTSVSLNACYTNACGTGGYRIFKMSYCALTGCAADANPIGYNLDQAYNVTLNGCGGEGNTVNTVKINGGYGNAARSLFVLANHGVGVWVTGSAGAIVIEQAIDVDPHVAATNFIKVDSGCRAALLACNNTSPNSLATGTTSVLTDGSGNLTVTGAIASGGSLTIAGDGVLSRPSAFALKAENNFQVGSTFAHQGANAGFYGAAPVAQPAVTGAKGGNAALTSLIQKLAAIGLISDSTT